MKKLLITVFVVVLCLSLSAWAQKETAVERELPHSGGDGLISACDAVSENVVSNCGFETGNFSSWDQSGDLSFTSVTMPSRHTGLWGMFTGPVNELGYISQAFTTVPGESYNLSFWLANQQTPNRFVVQWNDELLYDQTDMPNFGYTRSDALPVGDTSRFNGIVATGGAVKLSFGFFNIPDFFSFDDVVLVRAGGGGCTPGMCGTFTPCSPEPCYCFAVAEGGGRCLQDFFCDTHQNCTTSSECPGGRPCLVNTCCGVGKCGPLQCQPGIEGAIGDGWTASGSTNR